MLAARRLVEIEPFKVELADGSEVECKYKVEKLNLKFKSFRHDTELYVMDFKGAHDIILGRDFLYRRNPIIDWKTGEMTLCRKTSNASAKGEKDKPRIQRKRELTAHTKKELTVYP